MSESHLHPERGFNLSRWAIEHVPLTRFLMVVLMLLGAASYFQLGQDEDPPFTFRAMAIRAYWPGASAQQVAEQVTDKLERVLQEVPYADVIRSYAKPGEAQIIFQIKDSSPPAEVAGVWYTVRKKIADQRHTLPAGVQGPFFNDDFGDVFGVIYALQAPEFSADAQKTFADMVRQQLLRVPDVAKVEVFGLQDEAIYIEFAPRRLATLGLDLNAVLAQLQAQNAVQAAGVWRTPSEGVGLRVQGAFNALQDVRALPLRAASGQSLRLGDIAQVRRAPVDPPQVQVRFQGQASVTLGVAMAKGGDIIALGRALKAATQRIQAGLPLGVRLLQVQDQPQAVARSVGEFVRALLEAVAVVLAVSFLSLGLHRQSTPGLPLWRRYRLDPRPGLVVAVSIPLVLAMTFLVMSYWGIGLHKISLGSLIIALGLLVDDAIIAVEMMVRKLEEGWDKARAATYAYESTAMPMLTGTLITASGFLPIGLARSSVGEYTYAIFAVTVIALVLSWWVSVYFVPYLGVRLLRVPAHPQADDPARAHAAHAPDPYASAFYQRFKRLVEACVRRRWLTLAVTVLLFALGLVGMGRVQQQFFPDSSRPEVLIDIWLPEGASIEANAAVAQRVETRLRSLPGVQSVATWVGSGVPRFYLPLDQIFPQTNVSQFIVQPQDLAVRARLLAQLPALLAQEFPQVRARVKLLPNGPPVPYPVQFRVVGDDPVLLRERADEVKQAMRANPHTRGVNDNWNEAVKVQRLSVDQDKARALGVSSQAIAQASQMALSGVAIGQYREGDRLLDIVLRQPPQTTDLAHIDVPTASGHSVPLSQVAQLSLAWEPGVLWREGRSYAITVQSDVAAGLQGATVSAELLPVLRNLEAGWARQAGAAPVRIDVAGAVAESSKGASSIAVGVPVMLFITFTLLMLQLHSFSRALLVFLTGPLGIAGVAAALLLLDRPFGFVALLGVIALMGMIQRNAVILIDQIEQDRARGLSAFDAVVGAAVRRLRPIALTAAAAILAMIPLSRSVFWGPMAVAIMGGLLVATVLTLLALPALYAIWFKVPAPPRPV